MGLIAWPAHPGPAGRVRVGLLAPCLVQGGAEAWMVALSRHVDPAKVAWAGTAIGPGGCVDPAMVDALGERMPVAQGREAMRALASASDVLVTWAIDDLPGLLAGIPSPPKVVSAIHAPIESEWGRTVYARPGGIDRWVAVSELALEALPEESRQAAPSSVIWNAVDGERMEVRRTRAEMRASWGVPGDAPVAVFLQRLGAEKDAQAAARLAGSLPAPWRVVVVGGGSAGEELLRMKREAGLDRLLLVGRDPRAGDVLHASDVFLCCSDYESFGLSMAEAIWAGLPMVTTDVGIARLAAGISRVVPFRADGRTLALAVVAAHVEGAPAGARAILPRLRPDRFGREWTDLVVGLAGARRRSVARQARLSVARNACEHGSRPPDCGCGDELVCDRKGGERVGREACYQCLDGHPVHDGYRLDPRRPDRGLA